MSIPWIRTLPRDWWSDVKISTGRPLIAFGTVYGPELLVLEGDSMRGLVFRKEITYRQRGRRVEVGGGMYGFEGRPGMIPWGDWRLCIVVTVNNDIVYLPG